MTFEQLKKNRASSLQNLVNAASEGNTEKNKYVDERFWSPSVDKAGNGFAVIRFLPDPDGKEFTTYYQHGFQGFQDHQNRPEYMC